jgi:hypothetical protein
MLNFYSDSLDFGYSKILVNRYGKIGNLPENLSILRKHALQITKERHDKKKRRLKAA